MNILWPRYTLIALALAVAHGAAPLHAQTTINRQLSASSDDAEQASNGSVQFTQARLNYGAVPWVGLRFQNITIPQNALIVSAYVQLRADVNDSAATTATIFGEAVDDGATFTTTSNSLSTRSRTSSSTAWNMPSWTAGTWYNSPEIATVVQEIVDRAGWASGNDLNLLIRGDSGQRRGSSYNASSTYAPILVVQYAVPTTYYVRTDGSDSNAGTGTATSQAWRTINKALQSSVVNPGDTIYVRPGTYNESVTPNEDGTAARPIKLIADTSGAIFGTAGTVLVQAPSGNEALDINGDDYLQFTGFALRGEDGTFDTVVVATALGTQFSRCTIYNGGDKGIEMSGGTTTLTLSNCLIYDNNNDGLRMAAGTLTLWNTTIAGNGADGFEQDTGTAILTNSIFANNADDGMDLNGGTLTHTYNCVNNNAGGNFEGTSQATGETTNSPLFIGGGNYRLSIGSAAVNTGTSSGGPPGIDIDGATRPIGAGYDMGCYEFGGALLVGHWKLDESSGSTASDASGNANHGTLNGLTFSNSLAGRDSTGLNFEANDYIAVANHATLQITSALTITAWIKGDAWGSGSDVDAILRKGTDNPNNYQLAIASGRIELTLDGSDNSGIKGNTTLQTGTWYHVAATWDGANVRIYLNGVLDMGSPTARSGTISTDTRSLYIGGRASADYFDGVIDDVRLYNYALTDAEIRNAYGLLGYWKFDETSPATTAADSSGNGYSAPRSGNTAWATGRVNGAAYFDGSGDYATTSSSFATPPDGTITFWMKSAALGGTQRILGNGGDWEIRQAASGVVTFDIAGDIRFETAALQANKWYHLAAMFDDTNDKYALYVNGTLYASGTQTFTPQAAAALSFGTRTGSTEYWHGTLDEVYIYNRRMTATEVQELYNGAPALGVHILKWNEVQ